MTARRITRILTFGCRNYGRASTSISRVARTCRSYFHLQITVLVAVLIESDVVCSKTFLGIFRGAEYFALKDHRDHCIFPLRGTIFLPEERTGVPERNIRDPYFRRYLPAIWQRYEELFSMYVGWRKTFQGSAKLGHRASCFHIVAAAGYVVLQCAA